MSFPWFSLSPFYPQQARFVNDEDFPQPRMFYVDGYGPAAHFPRTYMPTSQAEPPRHQHSQDFERALRQYQIVSKQLEQEHNEKRQEILEREFARRNAREACMRELKRRMYLGHIDEDEAEAIYLHKERHFQNEARRDAAILKQLEREQQEVQQEGEAYVRKLHEQEHQRQEHARRLKEQQQVRQYEEFQKELQKQRAAQHRQNSVDQLLDTIAGRPAVMTQEQQEQLKQQQEEALKRHKQHIKKQKDLDNTPHGIMFPDGRTVFVNKGKKKSKQVSKEQPPEPVLEPKQAEPEQVFHAEPEVEATPEPETVPLTDEQAASRIQHAFRAARLNQQLPHVAEAAQKLEAVEKELEQLMPRVEQALSAPLAFNAEHGNLDNKTDNNKEFLTLEDALTKCLNKLDSVDSAGVEEIRAERKALVVRTTNALDKLDGWREKEWERWWKKVDEQHMKEANIDVGAVQEQVQHDIQVDNIIEDYDGEDEDEVLSREVLPIEPVMLNSKFIATLVDAITEVEAEEKAKAASSEPVHMDEQ